MRYNGVTLNVLRYNGVTLNVLLARFLLCYNGVILNLLRYNGVIAEYAVKRDPTLSIETLTPDMLARFGRPQTSAPKPCQNLCEVPV